MTSFAADRARRTTQVDRWLAELLGAEAGVALGTMVPERGFVPISTISPDQQESLDFAGEEPGFGLTDMVPV